MNALVLQNRRRLVQIGFFALFVLAPPLDLLRLDLSQGHGVVLGMVWTLGIDAYITGQGSALGAALNLLLRGFLPLLAVAGGLMYLAWRFGRVYCGWVCPHFSMVEIINGFMLRASGKPNLWEARKLPQRQPDGSRLIPNAVCWMPTLFSTLGLAFLWSVVLLTYLLPPVEVYANLISGQLTANQTLFIGLAMLVFAGEFFFARHLFCRYICAIGLFQSLSWMANPRALRIGFDRSRAQACRACNQACENSCPMRLKPRNGKRRLFSCTECGACISACAQVQQGEGLLGWVDEVPSATQGSAGGSGVSRLTSN